VGDVTHDKHDETTGKFAAEYSGEDFVDAVAARDLPTTSDVADAVGCAHRTALHHLNRLEEEGRVDSRMAGRAKLWRVLHDPESGEAQAPLDDVLDDLPKTVDPDAAREAILAARDYLEERETATKADFVGRVMRDYPLGYDPDAALAKLEAGERFRGAWWRKVVKPGLEAFDDVEKPPRGASDWRLVGSESDE
jgi:predicted ArsR family transcriptional regulator